MGERGPTLVVAAAIVKGKKILLGRRYQPELPEAHLRWELPGGKVRLEESPHNALIREIKEELGTDIKVVRLLPHVQNNIYHAEKGLVHSVVLAFESVILQGAKLPEAAEDAVVGVRWVEKGELDKLEILPGTREFIECLSKPDQVTYGSANIYIRLERRSSSGLTTDYWEIRSVYDLWRNFNILERHGNLVNRSSHYRVRTNLQEKELLKEMTKRIRTLASFGYSVVDSNDLRLCTGI